jgi:hypothetical protein
MGQYICQRCNTLRESREHGFHHALKAGHIFSHEYCGACYRDVLIDSLIGNEEFTAIDGKTMDEHFICPVCIALLPVAQLVQYRAQDDFVVDSRVQEGDVCTGCRAATFERLEKRGTFVTSAVEYSTGKDLIP